MGGAVTEMYSYHPAGAVTAKQMKVLRSGTDVDGNYGAGSATVEADYTYGGTGQMATFQLVENGVAFGADDAVSESLHREYGAGIDCAECELRLRGADDVNAI